MTVIAEFTIDADEFTLGEVLRSGPDAHIEMERVVPASNRVMPYIWVHGGHYEEFEDAIRSSNHVKSLRALDTLGDSALYRVEWDENLESLVFGMAETNATVLEARGDEAWFFRIRFDNHSGLTDFHNYCTDRDIVFKLDRIYTLTDEQDGGYRFDLSEPQQKALVTAVEDGYFEVPRRTTLSELGEKLGISEQSYSENVRRAADKVLKKVLFEPSAADLTSMHDK